MVATSFGGMSEMRVTKLHHASLLVETVQARVLIDPGSLGPRPDLDGLDAILITHDHYDHAEPQVLAEAAHRGIAIWAPSDAIARLEVQGESVHEAQAGDAFTIGDLDVLVAGDRHAEVHPDVPGPLNRAYLLGGRLFITGDEHATPPGPVEVLATPVDAPWLRATDLIRYVRQVQPRRVLGVHDGLINPEVLNPDGLTVVDAVLQSLLREGAETVDRLPVGDSMTL